MPSDSRDLPEQEYSIKARGSELFVERVKPQSTGPTKPFAVYLRETPAQPLSPFTKAVLSLLGIIVAVMLLAALWRITHRTGPPPKAEESPPAEKTTMEPRAYGDWSFTGVNAGRI